MQNTPNRLYGALFNTVADLTRTPGVDSHVGNNDRKRVDPGCLHQLDMYDSVRSVRSRHN